MSTTDNTTAPDGFDIRNNIAAAWGFGLALLPVQHDGTKKPRGKWKHLQVERLSLDETQALFTDDDTGFGIVCGAVSGNLEMLELEARAVEDGLLKKTRERLEKAGLLEEFSKILEGCCVETPSGGFHFVYRVEGGPALPNKKIALRLPTHAERRAGERAIVLIETRGEGGYFVAPSSHGEIHASGKQWRQRAGGLGSIATITAEVRDAIFDVLRSFDETPKEVDKATGVPLATVTPIEQPWTVTQWYEQDDTSPFDWFRQNHPSIGDLLTEDGWTTLNGTSWTRPGKSQREGTSAELHVADDGAEFLNIFSTSIPPEYERAGTPGSPGSPVVVSLSPGQLFAAVHHGGDTSEAARNIRVNWMPRLQPSRTLGLGDPAAEPGGLDRQADAGDSSPLDLGLAPSFWESEEWLTVLRQAAWSRGVTPDAVLGAFLARYAAAVHPSTRVPGPVVGSATFDHLSVIVGRSSAGKSGADRVAKELFGEPYDKVINWSRGTGSGEGLINSFLVTNTDEETRKERPKVIGRQATHFLVDEISQFTALAERSGTTISSLLCSAWTGQPLSTLNATDEKNRHIEAGRVRMSGLMAAQLGSGGKLLDDHFVDMGLTGRLVFFWAADEEMPHPDEWPEWPAGFPVHMPPPGSTLGHKEIALEAELAHEIRMAHWEVQTGRRHEPAIDGHSRLAQLKLASLFTLIAGRSTVTRHEWDLAGQVMTASRSIRNQIAKHQREISDQQNLARGRSAALRQHAAEEWTEERRIATLVTSIARNIVKYPDGIPASKLRKVACGSNPTRKALWSDALERAEQLGHVECRDGDDRGSPGIRVFPLS